MYVDGCVCVYMYMYMHLHVHVPVPGRVCGCVASVKLMVALMLILPLCNLPLSSLPSIMLSLSFS